MNNAQFAELLSDDDETALQYLENLTVEEYEDVRSGYTITFVSLIANLQTSFVVAVVFRGLQISRNLNHLCKFS